MQAQLALRVMRCLNISINSACNFVFIWLPMGAVLYLINPDAESVKPWPCCHWSEIRLFWFPWNYYVCFYDHTVHYLKGSLMYVLCTVCLWGEKRHNSGHDPCIIIWLADCYLIFCGSVALIWVETFGLSTKSNCPISARLVWYQRFYQLIQCLTLNALCELWERKLSEEDINKLDRGWGSIIIVHTNQMHDVIAETRLWNYVHIYHLIRVLKRVTKNDKNYYYPPHNVPASRAQVLSGCTQWHTRVQHIRGIGDKGAWPIP